MVMQDRLFIGGYEVKREKVPLRDLAHTGSLMEEMVRKYNQDIPVEFVCWSLVDFFDLVKALPYIPDPKGTESVQRPKFTLDPNWEGSRDCDDKAIVIGAWLYRRFIPFRFLAVAYEPGAVVSHAVVECHPPDAKAFIVDATYPHIKFPNEGPYYSHTAISRWIKP